MPMLNNTTDIDLPVPSRRELVPAGGSIEISDAEASEVNTVSGIWTITASAPQRRTITRGAGRVEVTGAPEMETR